MADDKNQDPLLGLFSTRSTQKIDATTPGQTPSQPQNPNNQPGIRRSTLGAGARPSTGSPSAQEAARRNTGGVDNRANATRAGLSPLASAVLREARRELGTDFEMQISATGSIEESTIVKAVEKVLKRREEKIDDIERANIIIHLQKDLLGWGVLQPLIDNREVTDIHVYDYQTVVLQRGKQSEATGLHWPSHQAYMAFIDRLLMRVGKTLSTQQHTIDASYPNGIRICAVHQSVCGSRGPYLCIRVPRVMDASLDSMVSYQVAPPIIVDYLASLTRSGLCTMMFAGETGTGKTTFMRCLATQFGPDEAIVSVEDTPELNLLHPFYRCLVSRTANSEGIGEVTLQEHIKTTLRMTPTRVLLGEMRTPLAAEAFLEAAQTGHIGMSTVHARNARETIVRLESLLGRAQKAVSVEIIRQQIALAVDVVVWLVREKGSGKPRVGEIIEVGHFVEGNVQVRPMFTLLKRGAQPVWRLDSWSSNYEEILAADGIFLGDYPKEISLNTVATRRG